MRKSKLSLAALLGLYAGMLTRGPGPTIKRDSKPKPSTKMPLDPDELKHLATLSGKAKKIYVKKLREKYK